MPTCNNLAAVVVLYNPTGQVLDNVDSYRDHVGVLYVVDNSDHHDASVIAELRSRGKVVYIQNHGNLGIATALNLAAEHALDQGFEYLLTMDQDSRALRGMVEALTACHGLGVALVAPFLQTRRGQASPAGKACRPAQTAMTSGSLLDLRAYRQVGPFRDDFFIDFVDIEYCLRLRRHGYKLLQADGARLEHHVGKRIGTGWFGVTTHSPLRKYYKTRNRFQVWREYGRDFPGYVRRDRLRFVLELARLLLFEPEKKAKLRMMWRGWRDYRRGKCGKYEE